MRVEPVHRGIVAIDIVGSNRPGWTDPIRKRLRGRLRRLLDDALTFAQVDPSQVARKDTGDGWFLIVDSEVSTARLLHPLATHLAASLAADNQQAPPTERLRLRVVVHHGPVLPDPPEHAGASVAHATRLLDAQTVRDLLAGSPAAVMILVVSDQVHHDVVAHGYEGIPTGWQPIRVHAKETSTRAWVYLPGLAVQPAVPTVLATPRVGPAELPIPRELPSPPADFAGRTDQLTMLRTLLDPGSLTAIQTHDHVASSKEATYDDRAGAPVVISAIDGMGGIGKSALALQVSSQLALADRFPDGQLYVNLQGSTPGLPPLPPLEALGRMLRSLGVDPAAIPTQVEEAAARFRSLAAGRLLLVVLDNARDAQQVRLLLPGSPTCRVLITSRQRLGALEGARVLRLDILPAEQALELLGRIAGQERLAAQPKAAAELVRLCGYLPLAIRIVGARLADRPGWPIQELVERLADAAGRPDLEEFTAGELAVQASFAVSLDILKESPTPLDQEAAAAFGWLGLPDVPDLGVTAVARLLDLPERTTRRLLERMVDAQLLESPEPDRYQFHDLVRAYARSLTAAHDPADCDRAMGRMLDYYLWHAATAARTLRPHGSTVDVDLSAIDAPLTRAGLDTREGALEWFEVERANLVACVGYAATHQPSHAVGLATEMAWFLRTRGHWNQALSVHHTALAAAHHLHDRNGQAGALLNLGIVRRLMGEYAAAAEVLAQALALYRDLGDRHGQADALDSLGEVQYLTVEYAEAAETLAQALALYRDLGDRLGQANALTSLGNVRYLLDEYAEAAETLTEAFALYREIGSTLGQANALDSLGELRCLTGEYEAAAEAHTLALALYRDLGDRLGQASALRGLGVVRRLMGEYAAAAEVLAQALALYRDLGGRHGEASALRDLGVVRRLMGEYAAAAEVLAQALALFRDLGDQHGEANVFNELGKLTLSSTGPDNALAYHSQALKLATTIHSRLEEARALEGIGRCLLQHGSSDVGAAHLRQALAIYQRLGVPEARHVAVALTSFPAS